MMTHNASNRPRTGGRTSLTMLACLTMVTAARAAPAQLAHDRPAAPAPAREEQDGGIAFHTLLGAFLPVGTQRRELDEAPYIGAQLALRLWPRLALVGGLAAAQTAAARLSAADADVTVWQYDAGIELAPWAPVTPSGGERRLVPFVGGGAGGRTYDYDERGEESRSSLTGYLSAGGELRAGRERRAGIRAEARTYFSRAEGEARRGVRADVVLAAGLTYHFR